MRIIHLYRTPVSAVPFPRDVQDVQPVHDIAELEIPSVGPGGSDGIAPAQGHGEGRLFRQYQAFHDRREGIPPLLGRNGSLVVAGRKEGRPAKHERERGFHGRGRPFGFTTHTTCSLSLLDTVRKRRPHAAPLPSSRKPARKGWRRWKR